MISFLDYFRSSKNETANVAKERLKIIVAHERAEQNQPNYLPQLKQELVDVISKYVAIDRDKISVQLDKEGDFSVLELNITLPESHKEATA